MNILEAKNEIKKTVTIYLDKNENGDYLIPLERQRPVLLIGAPGIGKTAIMSKIGEELGIGFLSYTLTHHTRQSALGLPYIAKETFGGREYSVTEYTMSEIVADVYEAIEKQGKKRGSSFLTRSTAFPKRLLPPCSNFCNTKNSARTRSRADGCSLPRETRRNITNRRPNSIWSPSTA